MFDYSGIDLPITEIIPQTKLLLEKSNTLILAAPPGAGKSTLLPLTLLDEKWLSGKKIIMLEPRRLAARTIAWRMSSLLDEECGQTVGYRVRFDTRISKQTKIEIVTEGILTRMLQSDNALEDVGLVIFDEFHERSLHADLALALCRQAQELLRPDLRILVMSATLDVNELTTMLKAPLVESHGRQFEVKIIHDADDASDMLLPEYTARVVRRAFDEQKGDLLVFLPGEGEIKKCASLLELSNIDARIHPLYGQLPQREQEQAIRPARDGRRKIVIATPIAETSLTIEGVRTVVDSGFGRTSRFDPSSGLTRLETSRISQDAATQRAGRAGRLTEGVCYRMWTLATHSRLAAQRAPEIISADLAPLVLEISNWGTNDVMSLSWLTPPPKAALSQASSTLHDLDALAENKITAHGKAMLRMGIHPRLAHMMLLAKTDHEKQLACDIASLLEERDPLGRESGIDLCLRIEALRKSRRGNRDGKFSRIIKAAAYYLGILKVEEDNGLFDPEEAGLLVAHAFPERIASARPGNNAQFQLANGKLAVFSHTDDLAHHRWLAVANMDMRDISGKIFLAAPLNPADLREMVKEVENISWDTRKGGIVATRDLRIGSIVLQSKPLTEIPPGKIGAALLDAIRKEGKQLLDFNEAFEQLQFRIESLRMWNIDDQWPDVSTEKLLSEPSWIEPYLEGLRKAEDLKKIDLSPALFHSLTYDQQRNLDQMAPSKLQVPSGSAIKVKYLPFGATPILAVRLQEVFGLSDTPLLNNGKIKVVMHLLSPGYKPVQVTSDLRSFWNNLYFEVKKELQRRYPKHSWPEDPWKAVPVAKGRSHK